MESTKHPHIKNLGEEAGAEDVEWSTYLKQNILEGMVN
jgi:hypothetical protein